MSGQLKVTYQTTASENHSCNQVVLFTLVSFHFKKTSLLLVHPYQLSLQEQITFLQIWNFATTYYWYSPSRRLMWKNLYKRVKWDHISLRLKVNIDYCHKFLFLDNWSWGKKCSTCLMFHTSFFLDNKWSHKLVRIGWFKVYYVVQNQTLNIWQGNTCV